MSKDVRRMVAEIQQALDAYSREQLADMLAWVFKEYVVEGAAALGGAAAIPDTRNELEGLSFAELMTWLLHLAAHSVPGSSSSAAQGRYNSVAFLDAALALGPNAQRGLATREPGEPKFVQSA